MAGITIFHNPLCSKSREALLLLRKLGHEPTIVEYLKNPPTRARLKMLMHQLGATSVRAMLRIKSDVYTELDLAKPKWSDDDLLDFMEQHPMLLERPVVVTTKGARIGRPTEAILEIL